MGVRLSIFFRNSGNGRRDFFYDDDDDNEFRAVSRLFRLISCSLISLTRTLPHRTLPKRRVRPGQVGSPDARTTKLSHDGRGRMRPRAESVLNTAGDPSEQNARNARFEGVILEEMGANCQGSGNWAIRLRTPCCQWRCLCIDTLSVSAQDRIRQKS